MAQSRAGQRRAAERDRKDLGPYISVEWEGTRYLLTQRDLTGLDVRAMREQLGYGFVHLTEMALAEMDADVLAAIVWATRRFISGEIGLTYDEVAAEVRWTDDWRFVTPDRDAVDGGDDNPET